MIASGAKEAAAVAGKRVLIVGGGDAALENALILAEKASEVFLVHRSRRFRGRDEFLDEVRRHRKIKIYTETILKKIAGGERVEAVELHDLKTGEALTIPIEIVLIRAGVEPNTEMLRGQIDLDANGYVVVDGNCKTSVRGVYAVGDAANPLAPTVSGAVSAGATAAKAIFAEIKRR